MNFGYTQVLFMGSVPRINHLLATVFWSLPKLVHIINIYNMIYLYNKLSKGVSCIYIYYLIL
jgi:hypothetical protein